MKKIAIFLLLAFSVAATAQVITFQNKALGVTFSTETGAFSVLDKRTDPGWPSTWFVPNHRPLL